MSKGKEFREIGRKDVAELLARGAHLVAATSALAADWRRRAMPPDAAAAPAPVARTWREWLRWLAASRPDMPAPLTRMQELALWEGVIEADGVAAGANAVPGLARLASDGWRLMREYRLRPEDIQGFGEEAEALARWACAAQARLARHHPGRALEADLPGLWLQAMETAGDAASDALMSAGLISEGLVLDGFEVWTPLQEAVLEALAGRGVPLWRVASAEPVDSIARVAAADVAAECPHVAARIREILARDAGARIVVLTTPAVDEEALRRALDEALLPAAMPGALEAPRRGVQAAACPGRPLDRWPRIAQALHFLGLAGQRRVALEDASPLLFAPWLAGFEDEAGARAALDASLRRDNAWRLTMSGLRSRAERKGMPRLARVLRALEAWEAGRRTAGEWARRAHQLLADAGWVRAGLGDGEARPDADEVRQMNALRDALLQLAELDAVMPPMSWAGFLARLRRACAGRELARPPLFPNVVVLPLEEAPGLQCDAAFVMGMDDASFPQATPPHPMLPPALALRMGLPVGNPERDYRRAAWLWDRVRGMAGRVECTFARQRDGVEQEPSAFIAGLPEAAMAEMPPSWVAPALEAYADAPPVPLPEGAAVGGGTALLGEQSACPFRAFVRRRLGARALEEAEPGIAPDARGRLAHAALDRLWAALGDSRRLAETDEAGRRALVTEAVARAWEQAGPAMDAALTRVEQARLSGLLLAWLRLEEARPPFVVKARELTARLALPGSGDDAGGLRLDLRVDRVDEDAEGRRIVLDYKTGRKQSARAWLDERPAEPQLPAYALALGLGARDAVAFARLRQDADGLGFEGLAGEDVGIRGIRPCRGGEEEWEEVLARWRAALDALAREFLAGRAEVAPRDTRACEYCGLEAVCRITERRDGGSELGDE